MASYPTDLPTGDPDSTAVIAGFKEYWRVYDKLAADPTLTDLDDVHIAAIGEARDILFESIAGIRYENLVSYGGFSFRDVSLQFLDDGPEGRRAEVTFCLDASKLIVVDQDTGVAPERFVNTLLERFVLWEGFDGRWRVAEHSNELAEC